MGTMMLTHVNELTSALYALERSLNDSLRAADKCHDCTVGGLTWVHIKNLHTTSLLDRSYDRIDDFHIAAFTEIRHAFDNSFHICFTLFWLKKLQPIKVVDLPQLSQNISDGKSDQMKFTVEKFSDVPKN
jgi:hypothetical protein